MSTFLLTFLATSLLTFSATSLEAFLATILSTFPVTFLTTFLVTFLTSFCWDLCLRAQETPLLNRYGFFQVAKKWTKKSPKKLTKKSPKNLIKKSTKKLTKKSTKKSPKKSVKKSQHKTWHKCRLDSKKRMETMALTGLCTMSDLLLCDQILRYICMKKFMCNSSYPKAQLCSSNLLLCIFNG